VSFVTSLCLCAVRDTPHRCLVCTNACVLTKICFVVAGISDKKSCYLYGCHPNATKVAYQGFLCESAFSGVLPWDSSRAPATDRAFEIVHLRDFIGAMCRYATTRLRRFLCVDSHHCSLRTVGTKKESIVFHSQHNGWSSRKSLIGSGDPVAPVPPLLEVL